MKLYFANWAMQIDFERHRDDGGYDQLIDLASVNGNLYLSHNDALDAALADYNDHMDDMDEGNEGLTWSKVNQTPTVQIEAVYEGHNRAGELDMIVVVREYELLGIKADSLVAIRRSPN
jgi:hypothetical protein